MAERALARVRGGLAGRARDGPGHRDTPGEAERRPARASGGHGDRARALEPLLDARPGLRMRGARAARPGPSARAPARRAAPRDPFRTRSRALPRSALLRLANGASGRRVLPARPRPDRT